jgi:hypothetical protein
MSTFGTMKARIAREMKRGELSACATAVQDSVLSAIKLVENYRFAFNEFNDVTVTASSSATYVPFSRILSDASVVPVKIDTIKVVVSGRDYPLDETTWAAIDSIDAGQWYGYPDRYAVHSENIRLYPPPNQNMVLKIAGAKRLLEVTAGAAAAATNGWMVDAEEMIRCVAKGNLFRDELRNPTAADYFYGEAVKTRRELQRRATNLASSGRVRVPRMI